jgi:transcriptional regulator with XRE-family HTH domain
MSIIEIKDMVELGSFIKKRRKSLGLRIDDTASLCEVAVSTLSAMENGSRPIGMDKLMPVLKGLGIGLFISDGME